jgi:hypothetical protein
MNREPDPLDFVEAEPEWSDQEKVIICEAEYPLTEFTQAERHLWLKIREEANLVTVIKEFTDLRRELEGYTGGTIAEKKDARIKKLNAEIDQFIDSVPFDEWNETHDDKLNRMVAALDKAKAELDDMQRPLEDQALHRVAELQGRLDEIRERQNDVYLKFVHKLAQSRHGEKRSWEEYVKAAKGSDRNNAVELVNVGNFTWETQGPTNRAQRRANRKN